MPLRRLALAALVAIPAAHARADALADRIGQIPAEVEETRLVGEWTEGTETGTYRIVVVRTGLQEVRTRLFVQWIVPSEAAPRLKATTEIEEVIELGGDVKETTIELADNTLQMTVDLGGSARTAGQYLVTVEAPGRYSFKKAPPAPQ
ncbi:hypothetical protein C2U72_21145 [Prosthecomicrobium hirschii]|uniref:hypothetical protein n=1 Tax=Prosthecodimorpha hirschii TaxID=665126 RepID=UPI00112E652C|nr:hypothetical protein [Prosthecomicrobium hirschii]TPQ48937.1 hypothetical protein C2U72_21145 [Prosthecomicrobium hirschii]